MWAMGLKVVASLAAMSTLAVASPMAVAQAARGGGEPPAHRILVYGDSNTWGFVALEAMGPTTRYPSAIRWTGRLAAALGPDYQVIEDGLNLRTTNLDGEQWPDVIITPRTFNGAEHLPAAIAANMPLDLVVILLGTNDLQARYEREPEVVAEAAMELGDMVRRSTGGIGNAYPAPKVLIVAPPAMGEVTDPVIAGLYAGGPEKSQGFSEAFEAAARAAGLPLFDSGAAIGGPAHGIDGVHLSEADHAAMATAIEPIVRRMVQDR